MAEEENTFDPFEVLIWLPPLAKEQVMKVLERMTPENAGTQTKKLKGILGRYKKELEEWGLVVDYYVYALRFAWQKQHNQPIHPEAKKFFDRPPKLPSARDFFGPHGMN